MLQRSPDKLTNTQDKIRAMAVSPTRVRPMPPTVMRTLDMLASARGCRRHPGPAALKRAGSAPSGVTRSAAIAFSVAKSSQSPGNSVMSSAHSDKCFSAFDDVIPKLGVYARIAKIIRDELFDAVHSDEYTSDVVGNPTRVPYFVLVNRARAEQMEAIAVERRETQRAYDAVDDLQKSLDVANNRIAKLEAEVADVDSKIAHAAKIANDSRAEQDSLITSLQTQISELESLVAKKEVMISELTSDMAVKDEKLRRAKPHVDAYTNLETAFDLEYEAPLAKRVSHKSICKKGLIAAKTSLAELYKAYNSALSAVESQLLDCESGVTDPKGAVWRKQQERFHKSLDVVNSSIPNIKSHMSNLDYQMDHLNSIDPREYETEGQFDVNHIVNLDKFHSVLEFSTDGTAFDQYKGPGTSYDKHWNTHLLDHPSVVQLDDHITHLRFDRPIVMDVGRLASDVKLHSHQSEVYSKGQDNCNPRWHRLRQSIHTRTSSILAPPRSVDQSFVVATIEHFFTHLMNRLDGAMVPSLAIDSWFLFLEGQYGTNEASLAGARDIFAFCDRTTACIAEIVAGQEYSVMLVWMLCLVLSGDICIAQSLYFFELRKHFRKLSWANADMTTRAVIGELYSFAKDQQEDLYLNVQGGCGNDLSCSAMENYILSMLLRDAMFEPRTKHVLERISRVYTVKSGFMNKDELIEAAQSVAPTATKRFTQLVFDETILNFRESTNSSSAPPQVLPKALCAQIVGYLEIVFSHSYIFEPIEDRIAELPAAEMSKREASRRLRQIADRKTLRN